MQREILFRGFHPCDGSETIVVDGEKVKGKWVEGYIVRHPSAIQIGNDYSPWYIHVPPVDPDDNGGVFNVFPSTVGQYSGLTDQNGKRIFEGDIISIANPKPFAPWVCEVMYEDCCFWLKDNRGVIRMLTDYADSETEVIGTVFDEEAPQ